MSTSVSRNVGEGADVSKRFISLDFRRNRPLWAASLAASADSSFFAIVNRPGNRGGWLV
jgi:hypothetical protein